ncbi:MAG: hypothetical protein ACLQVN_13865 [Bryobacteraceae bacterium]
MQFCATGANNVAEGLQGEVNQGFGSFAIERGAIVPGVGQGGFSGVSPATSFADICRFLYNGRLSQNAETYLSTE